MTEVYHDPLSKMTFDTEIYLKLPSAGYLGRQFTVYLDAMGAPHRPMRATMRRITMLCFPRDGTAIKMQQIRHTYLHYLLDPLAMKNNALYSAEAVVECSAIGADGRGVQKQHFPAHDRMHGAGH